MNVNEDFGKLFELKDNLEKQYCDDPYFELFTNGLNPEKYLKNEEDIEEIKKAIFICKKYLKSLEEGNQLES